jgi:hypothetical protein
MNKRSLASLAAVAVTLTCAGKSAGQATFFLPLRLEAAGTCIGSGATTDTIETQYGAGLASLPFTGTTAYDFYSPPIIAAPSLVPADKAAGQLWLTNSDPSADFNVTLRFSFYDYDPATGVDTLIADTKEGGQTKVKRLQSAVVVTPTTALPGNFTAQTGHLLHIRATVTLLSGTVTSAAILFNAPAGSDGDSAGLLPQHPTSKTWTFALPATAPDATITPSASSVCANSSGNCASVPSLAGATYVWSVTNGTITAGQGTDKITWTAASCGPAGLSVSVTKGCSATGSAAVTVSGAPGMLSLLPMSDGTTRLTCAGTPGQTYRIEASASLAPAVWSTIASASLGADGLFVFNDLNATNYPCRFYRASTP